MVDIVYNKEYRAFMKMAKSYKIIILLTAFVMSLALAIGGFNYNKANAFTAPTSASSFLELVSVEDVEFNDESLDITLTKNANKFSFKQLVIDNFEMNFSLDGATAFAVELSYSSYFVNGAEKDDKFVNSITNKFDVEKTGDVKIGITVVDNFPVLTVDGDTVEGSTDDYYRIGFADAPVAKITIIVETETQATFALKYVDQKATDEGGLYKQTFESKDGKLTDTDTYPRVTLDKSFFTRTAEGEKKIIKSVSKLYTPTVTPYSVLNNVKNSDLYFVCPEGSDVQFNTDSNRPKKIFFPSVGESVAFAVTAVGLEDGEYISTYNAEVIDPENSTDNTAPVYVKNESALKAFEDALKDAILDGDHYIALGTELNIPSLEDLVFDDQTPYSELSVKLYYKSATESLTSDKLSFDVDYAGDYTFYVVFTDAAGNAMEVTDFIDEDEEGNQYIVDEDLVFNFYISDNAPIKVVAPTSKSIGFTGVKFISPSFEVDAEGCKTTYKLYYISDKNATIPESKSALESAGWVEIPKASSITDKNYDKDGFNYETVKAIGYDGERTFTPNAIGSYLIECTATSEVTHRSATDYSVLNVSGAPQTVKVPSNWLQNNVWSVVFLSLGTLCLIGIVILLFIKPKDETEGD